LRYLREGLNPPAAVRNATTRYRAEEDVVGRFLADVLDFSSPHDWCYSSTIAAELNDWCAEQGIAAKPRMNEIVAAIKAKGGKDRGRKQVGGTRSTMWMGVSIASAATHDEGKSQ
jgi:hypothetical protein